MKALDLCVQAKQPNTDSLKFVLEVKKKTVPIENFFALVTSDIKPSLNVA